MSNQQHEEIKTSWLDVPLSRFFVLNWETIVFTVILLAAVLSRFYDLGARVMSHDENTHVYYSWRYYKGEGFSHDPLMHGPLQFHLMALIYFMFGDTDFTARIPHALFSIAAVFFIWYYRRYLGRIGAILAATFMVISPYMLYYGRYARNEALVNFFGVVTLWAILRYLETGRRRYAYWLTAIMVLHFTSKETSFIYAAQALLFLAFFFVFKVMKAPWRHPNMRKMFMISVISVLVFMNLTGGFGWANQTSQAKGVPTNLPPGGELVSLPKGDYTELVMIFGSLTILFLATGLFFLVRGYSWSALRKDRAFSLIILLGTLVLPQLSAFPINLLKWNIPTNASQVAAMTTTDMLRISVFVVGFLVASAIVGLAWNRREWLINAAIWYSIFTVFYTSVFTNGAGFFTGIVGSLGYWLAQQEVNRGSQPWYYYGLVQVPIYEFLPALGTWLAFGIYFVRNAFKPQPDSGHQEQGDHPGSTQATLEETEELEVLPEFNHEAQQDKAIGAIVEEGQPEEAPVFPLLGFWAVTSLLAYSIAGEKMPWLTVHVTLPTILCAGWGIGQLVEKLDLEMIRQMRTWIAVVLIPVFMISFFSTFGTLLGSQPPFQGKTLMELSATSTFLLSFLSAIASGVGIFLLLKGWSAKQLALLFSLGFFGILSFLTARTAFTAAFINYDNANELLVYAHSGPGVKKAMAQIEEISQRTTDGLDVIVAYDNETSYPYWWYLRNYRNTRYYSTDPTRSLREAPLILVGDANFGKLEPVVRQDYYSFEYIRMWWPNQDYFGLNLERIVNALRDPQMREALFQIWLNRDYAKYGLAVGRDISLPNWTPAARFRLYIRKDVVAQLWNYGAAPAPQTTEVDPFEGKQIQLTAIITIGGPGNQPGQFQGQRDVAVAADGSLYVVDTGNHRIQHLSPDGKVLQVWGFYSDSAAGTATDGGFNQPWGIGLGPDGSVYVADTWNHRIQKFTPDGEFITKWGYFGQAENPEAFWGPRDVAVNAKGQVFVTDTGNKRVVVFDQQGNYLGQFGGGGLLPGEFDEPVGITIGTDGLIYVADTWNQRIQVFMQSEGVIFTSLRTWDVLAWFGQSLDNKPYLAVDAEGNLYAVDPEGYRIMVFSSTGEALYFWGDYSVGMEGFGLVAAVALDGKGGIWVSDSGNSRLMYFTLP